MTEVVRTIRMFSKADIGRIFLHLLFWLSYLGFNTLLSGYYGSRYWTAFQIFAKPLPIIMAVTYLTNYILVPKYLLTRRYTLFTVYILLSAAFFTICQKIVFTQFVLFDYYGPQGRIAYFRVGFLYPTYLLSLMFDLYSTAFVFGFVKVFRQWYQSQQIAQKLQMEKSEAELKFLKAQLNPHFLFNVLNNLYALALKKSDKTPEMILRLSSMMDFLLHEAGQQQITLAKELILIDDYIELEKLRYGERLRFDMKVSGNPEQLHISPLIVFPFIENSFKHGASSDIASPFINISLHADKSALRLKIANSKGNTPDKNKEKHAEGIGLKNTQRRLNLVYPGRHSLNIEEQTGQYIIELNIELIDQQ